MSRLFEFLQKLNGGSGDLRSHADIGAATSAEKILSVLDEPDSAGHVGQKGGFDLNCIPSITVDLQPQYRLVVHTDPNGLAADRFRLLRMRLREFSKARKVKSVLITSPLPQDGKSVVTMNLAGALAEEQKQVLVIDADVHHSSLTERLGLLSEAGLADCLRNDMSAVQAVRKIEPLGWYCLSAGRSQDVTGLIQAESFSQVMNELSPHFDWVLIDSAPIIPLSDAVLITKHVDCALLVIRAGVTSSSACEDAIGMLGRDRIAGVVLNSIEHLEREYSNYHEYYYAKNSKRRPSGTATRTACA